MMGREDQSIKLNYLYQEIIHNLWISTLQPLLDQNCELFLPTTI